MHLYSPCPLLTRAPPASGQVTAHLAPPPKCGPGMRTFLKEPPGPEKGIPQRQEPQALLEAGVQPPHQRVDCGVSEAEGGRGEHIGHRRVHGGVVSPVGAHVLREGLGAQDFGDVIPQGDDLRRKESGWEPGQWSP